MVVIGARGGSGDGAQPSSLIGGAVSLQGIMVGSRVMLEELVAFVERTGIRPVVDKVYPFGAASEAFRDLAAAEHFGKIAIEHGR